MAKAKMIPKPTDQSKEKTKPSSDARGKVNEILLGYHLKPPAGNNPFSNFNNKAANPKLEFDKNAKLLPMEFYKHEDEKARLQAAAFRNWAVKNGYATSANPSAIENQGIYWTAGKGQIAKAMGLSTDAIPSSGVGRNPTDVLVKFKGGHGHSFLGNSAKSTGAAEKDVPFYNFGLGDLEKKFGKGYFKVVENGEAAMIKKVGGLLPKDWNRMSQAQKEDWYRVLEKTRKGSGRTAEAAQALKDEMYDIGLKTIAGCRDRLMKDLIHGDWTTVCLWLEDFVSASYLGPQYIKVTGRGMSPYSVALEVPEKSKKVMAVRKDYVELLEMGQVAISVYDKDTAVNVFNIRFKWASRPFSSSMKGSGDSTGKAESYIMQTISDNPQVSKVKGTSPNKMKHKSSCG
jgi:hypothetical protein